MSIEYRSVNFVADKPAVNSIAAVSSDQSRLCLECARLGQTCCQGHDIYITRGDCLRIFNFLQHKQFYEYRACSNPAYAEQNDDLIWQKYVFRADGSRRVLRRKENGDCLLLSSSGCALPLNLRPLVCRLFPHNYSAGGISAEWDSDCPAATMTAAAVMESEIAGISQCDAVMWHQMLYNEVLWEKTGDEDWINL